MRSTKAWSQIVIVAVISITVILQGCASLPAGDEVLPTKLAKGTSLPNEPPLPSPDPDATSIVGTQDDTQEGIVLVYKRSGGFAGLDEEFTIFLDGRISTKDGREVRVDPEEIDVLVRGLEKLGVFELVLDYMPKDTCCDRFFYELSVNSGDHSITIRTIDSAPNAPDQLWAVLKLVENFLDQAFEG